MEYSREQVLLLKADIATLVAEQKSLRLQRKTVHFTGERQYDAGEAASRHSFNRWVLRYRYIGYAIMRGKTLDQVEPNRKTEPLQSTIDKILEKYGQTVRSSPV